MARLESVFVGFDLDDSAGSDVILGVTLRGAGATGSLEIFTDPVALADNVANPTVGGIQTFGMLFDGTNWDRMLGDQVDGLLVNLGANTDVTNAGVFVVQENGAALTALELIDNPVQVFDTDVYTAATDSGMMIGVVRNDVLATLVDADNDVAPLQVDAAGALYTTIASSVALDVSAATVTVDTELPAAVLLSDALAVPTAPAVGSYLLAYDRVNDNFTRVAGLIDGEVVNALNAGLLFLGSDGTNYLPARTDAAGNLQVDVLSGGGGPPAPTAPVNDIQSITDLAAGTPTDLDSSSADGKRLTQIELTSSSPFVAELRTVDDGTPSGIKAMLGGPAHKCFVYVPPHPDYIQLGSNAGLDVFRMNIENLGRRAADVQAVYHYET